MSSNILTIRALEYSYTSNKPVLNIPELSLSQGEHVFLYGPSGSGKTTLLGLLAGVLPIQKGQIQMLGQNLENLSPSARDRFRGDHIGYIFQMFNLIPYLSVAENILLPLELNKIRASRVKNAKEDLWQLCTSLGIESLLERRVTELSVGQQQRVAAARALMGKPEIIIADEPTSALDYDHREKFLQLLISESKKSNATVIFVSHDRTLEKQFSRVISLQEIQK